MAATRGHGSWPIVLTNGIFLLLNFAILAAAKSSLADLLVEFGIPLSMLSSRAYSIANHSFVVVTILLCFAVGTTVVQLKLKTSRRRFAFNFSMVVAFIWMLFTSGFAFGIFHPLYGVVTGLTN